MFHLIWNACIWLIAIKSILIGSEFNFYYWIKYGKKYTKWYNQTRRPKFKE